MSRRIRTCEPATRIGRMFVWVGALLLVTASCSRKEVNPQTEATTGDVPKVEAKKDVPTAEYCGKQLPIDITEIWECQNTRNFEQIGAFTNLRLLSVSASWGLKDLSVLSKLKKLEVLYVNGVFSATDYAFLAELKNLKKLDLSKTRILDLRPLVNLTQLEDLSLRWCESVKDITPLENLRKLKRLWLVGTAVEDISALSDLSALVELNLAQTKVRDISPLSTLTNLVVLDLSMLSELEDISAVSHLVRLKSLDIGHTKAKNIKSLSGVHNLESLGISWLNIKDPTPLLTLKKLKFLEIINTDVSDEIIRALHGSHEHLNIDGAL